MDESWNAKNNTKIGEVMEQLGIYVDCWGECELEQVLGECSAVSTRAD